MTIQKPTEVAIVKLTQNQSRTPVIVMTSDKQWLETIMKLTAELII